MIGLIGHSALMTAAGKVENKQRHAHVQIPLLPMAEGTVPGIRRRNKSATNSNAVSPLISVEEL